MAMCCGYDPFVAIANP